MRVLISVDMEGAAGVVDGEDVRPGEGAYEHNRGLFIGYHGKAGTARSVLAAVP
jgi:D-aminopeptidase